MNHGQNTFQLKHFIKETLMLEYTLTHCTFCALSSSVYYVRLLRDTGGFSESDKVFCLVTSEHFLFYYQCPSACGVQVTD